MKSTLLHQHASGASSGAAQSAQSAASDGAAAALLAQDLVPQSAGRRQLSGRPIRFWVGVGLCAIVTSAALRFDLTRLNRTQSARVARAERVYALVAAVDDDDLAAAREALDQGVDPNTRDNRLDMETRSLGQRLLDDTRRPGVKTGAPWADFAPTVLQQAVLNENVEMVALLLERGADPNRTSGFGDTPLIAACTQPPNDPTRRRRILRALLAYRADVRAMNRAGETALSRAADAKESETIRLLQSYGAAAGGPRRRP